MKIKKEQLVKWGIRITVAGMAAGLLDALFLERYFFEVRRFAIGRPDSGRKLRLVLLTDLHFNTVFWPYYGRLARKVNRLNPDLILITGDMLDDPGSRPGLVDNFLARLQPWVPKVAIPGNHDYISGADKFAALKEVYRRHGCQLLINQSVPLQINGTRVMVTGLDDFIESCASFQAAVKDVGREAHHLLLVHSPLQQETALEELRRINAGRSPDQQLNVQYIFAGHNHGGQVRLFNFVPVLPKKSGHYVNGWYNKEPPFLYVSRGFGTSTIPFRFGSRAEVTLFEYGV